jgi:hypothetical protein
MLDVARSGVCVEMTSIPSASKIANNRTITRSL